MGYTHYWEGTAEATPELLDRINAVIEKSGVKIAGGFGEGEPEVNEGRVWINGSSELDEDYETFLLDFHDSSWTFCKTAHRPYDAVVVAILMLTAAANPGFSWSSDGTEEDHAEGRALALSVS